MAMQTGEVESEYGVPIPGTILPESDWARTGVKRLPPEGPLDWPALFGREAAVVLDLGCGKGRFTLGAAIARPDCNFCGVDELPMVIRYATRRANQRGLHHVRFVVMEARAFLASYAAEGSIAEVHLYHPQPYHDPRQAHRRVLTPRFVADVHRVLRPAGTFVVQTDNPDYWNYLVKVVPHFFSFHEHPEPWPDAPAGRTRREIIARERGLKIFRGVGTPLEDLDRRAAVEIADKLPSPRFRSRGPWCELDRREEREGR